MACVRALVFECSNKAVTKDLYMTIHHSHLVAWV